MTNPDPPFRLDRERLRDHLRAEHDISPCLELDSPSGLAAAIVTRAGDAFDAAALGGPPDIELETYESDGKVLIAVREEHAAPDSPQYARQISTYSIDPRYLSARDGSEAACFAAVEAVLARASALVPTLRLLQHAEDARQAPPDNGVAPPHPLVHASDAVLRPGDIVAAASERGRRSRHARCPGYDPTKVYVLDADADPISYEQHGRHSYEVEPIGALSPDPERDPVRWPIADEDPFAFSWCCQSARVTRVIY